MSDHDYNLTEKTYIQKAPWPVILEELVKKTAYRKGWRIRLYSDLDRGQGSEGCTLVITTQGYDSYNPENGENYRVNHYMPVPPAAYDERSWRRWLFNQFLLVEQHECMEFFVIDGKRPYAPHHGPGNDCYNVFDHGTDKDKRTMYTGEVLKPKDVPMHIVEHALIAIYEKYVELFIEEEKAMIGLAHAHGYHCPDEMVKRGYELRQKIAELKSRIPEMQKSEENAPQPSMNEIDDSG